MKECQKACLECEKETTLILGAGVVNSGYEVWHCENCGKAVVMFYDEGELLRKKYFPVKKVEESNISFEALLKELGFYKRADSEDVAPIIKHNDLPEWFEFLHQITKQNLIKRIYIQGLFDGQKKKEKEIIDSLSRIIKQ